VGEQTRKHLDLDLIVESRDLSRAERALQEAGFALSHDQVVTGARMPDSVGLRDARGRTVDLHPMQVKAPGSETVSDLRGGVVAIRGGSAGDGRRSSPFTTGRIGGREVPCLSAQLQAAFRVGYDLRHHDKHDLALLARAEGEARGDTA
jgi:lincosamide nucleotidyltransferase A/C/D/E